MDNILNLVIVIGLLLIGSGLGLFVLHLTRLRASDGLQHVLLATGVGLGVVSFVPFGLAWAQQLSSLNLILAASVLVVTGLMAWRLFMPITIDELRLLKSRIYNLSRLDLVLILLISVLAILNLFAALAPVTGVDELIYRVADGSTYLKEKGFVYIPSKYSHQQPQLVMMLQMWGMSIGSDSASQVIQWAMGIIFILAIIDFARRFMPLTVSLALGMILYCASDVVVLSARAVPDLANSMFLFLSFVAFKLWLDTKNDRWLLLVGLLAGFFAAGSRLTGAYGAIAIMACIIIYGYRDKHIDPLRAIASGMLVAGIAFFMVLPWLIKSFTMTGNPVWPFLFDVFGAKDFTQSSAAYLAGSESRALGGSITSLQRIISSPWDLTFNPHNFRSGVYGPFILASIPAMFVTGLNSQLRKYALIALVSCAIWYFSFPRLRALIPIISLLTILGGYGFYKLWVEINLSRILNFTVKTFIGLLLLLWFLFGIGTHFRFHYDAVLETVGVKTEQEFLTNRLVQDDMSFYWYEEYIHLNEILPPGSKLLLHEGRGYYLNFMHERYFLIAQNELITEKLKDPEYVVSRVEDRNIDFVVLWPEFKSGTYYEPANWLEESLHYLCSTKWEVIYENYQIKVCDVKGQFIDSN
ncbi:MAG: glycosyltransferase family 39 protein [Dehalococcoidia bacterium]